MITMDVNGITWAGNIYQKFENMYLEVEEMIYEDTVKYIENQMQTVGETVKKFYADVMQDLLPPCSCEFDGKVTSDLLVDQYTDVGVCKKSIICAKESPTKSDTKQTNEGSRINHGFDNDIAASHDGSCKTSVLFMTDSGNYVKGKTFDSHSRHYVESTRLKSSLGINKNQQNKKMPPMKTMSEITSKKTDTCRKSSSCELSYGNHKEPCHQAAIVLKPASAEVTRLDSVVDCCNEIKNSNSEQIPNVPIFVKSAVEKETTISPSSSSILSGEPNGFSTDRIMLSDDCSYNTVILSHPEIPDTRGLDAAEIDAIIEQGHETVRRNEELELEETCVMVSGDELQLVPKAGGNLRTDKKKMPRAFSLCKKSARKQEYEQLAAWHGSSEKVKGACVNSIPTSALVDQKKLLLPNISETEWELL